MIDCILTIDYEIYGNGTGSLKDLVYEPSQSLIALCHKHQVRLVIFVEVAGLEAIEARGTDSAINLVKKQIRDFYELGFELGLHLHPQWYNARYDHGKWLLDYSEYNLCSLSRDRSTRIISSSIAYLRRLLAEPYYTPFAYRGGNWLFQPTQIVAKVLSEHGIKVDSSVFKGGLQCQHELDYRPALRNGYYWRFSENVNVPDPKGILLELPIHTQMVPIWNMLSARRIGLQRKGISKDQRVKLNTHRLSDFLRFRYPLKLDFCRMKSDQLMRMVDSIVHADKRSPGEFKPIVAIGHTKDLVDLDTLDLFLSYLKQNRIPIASFEDVYQECKSS